MNVSLKMSLRKFTLIVSALIATSLFVSCPVMGQTFTFPPDTVKLRAHTDFNDYYIQIKEKSSPRLDLRHKIGILITAGTAAYIFRDDLTKWSNRNDKSAHLLLSYGIAEIFGYKFAAGFMLAIEMTQADIFGMQNRWEDTAADLFVGAWGITLSWRFK